MSGEIFVIIINFVVDVKIILATVRGLKLYSTCM